MKHKLFLFLCLAFILPKFARSADINSAFGNLVDGRSYLDNRRLLIRDTLVNNFLSGEADKLRLAYREALAIRNDPLSSPQLRFQAWVVANEALEALLYGYHSAGSRDLLNGTRLVFPSIQGLSENRNRPHGSFVHHWDNSIQSLYYAHLYFQAGIKASLDFIATDQDGMIRAVDLTDETGGPDLPYYTKWNVPAYLPHPDFEDTAFNDEEDQWSLTGAALLGKSIRRYGFSVTTIANKLWRAAYFHPTAATNRTERLNEAGEFLRCNMHAQFMASLPIAATLNDGLSTQPDSSGTTTVTRNEYQDVGADVVRSTVTAAQILANRIANGERPKQADLAPRWDKARIDQRLQTLAGIKTTTEQAWLNAKQKIEENNNAIISETTDRLLRRDRYKFRLWQITGIHPDENPQQHNLDVEAGREAYLRHIESWLAEKTTNFIPTDPWFTRPLTGFPSDPGGGSSSTSVSEMGTATLRMMQAFAEVNFAQARIDAVPQQIAIESRRNQEVNEVIVDGARTLGAIDASIYAAGIIRVRSCACGLASGIEIETDLLAAAQAASAIVKRLLQANQTVDINNINSRAAIENLLLQQSLLIEEFPSVVIQAQISVNALKGLWAEVQQLVEDYKYHIDSTQSLWYNDPDLVFEKEAAEKRYEDLVASYQVELYKLSQMLKKAWVEPYENPVLDANGEYQSLGRVNIKIDAFYHLNI